MSTRYPEIFAALAAPFAPNEVRTLPVKKGRDGQPIRFVSGRTVMNRFDEVLGPENWTDEYVETSKGLRCRITVTLPDGKAVAKEDGGGAAGMADADDDEKSAFSSAFKRAAVKWGVARYLYRDGVARYEPDNAAPPPDAPGRPPKPVVTPDREATAARPPAQAPEEHKANVRNGTTYGTAKARREWTSAGTPYGSDGASATATATATATEASAATPHTPELPTMSAAQLYMWAKNRQDRTGQPVLNFLVNWGRQQGIRGRVIDWPPDLAALGQDAVYAMLRGEG